MKKFFRASLLLCAALFFFLLLLLFFLLYSYTRWQGEFENSMLEQNTISPDSVKDVDIQEKITDFVLSMEYTESLELELEEIGAILFDVIDDYLGDGIHLTSIYIIPKHGRWDLFLKLSYKKIYLWISCDVNKDEMQTAQLYITDIYVGPFSMRGYSKWVEKVNRGIADSIVTLNENGFVGRYLENIELLESNIVVKGSRY